MPYGIPVYDRTFLNIRTLVVTPVLHSHTEEQK
jgi:hypothetical protein